MESFIFLATENGTIPFLDTTVKPEADGTFHTSQHASEHAQ